MSMIDLMTARKVLTDHQIETWAERKYRAAIPENLEKRIARRQALAASGQHELTAEDTAAIREIADAHWQCELNVMSTKADNAILKKVLHYERCMSRLKRTDMALDGQKGYTIDHGDEQVEVVADVGAITGALTKTATDGTKVDTDRGFLKKQKTAFEKDMTKADAECVKWCTARRTGVRPPEEEAPADTKASSETETPADTGTTKAG